MTTEIINGMTYITADEGKFLTNCRGLYGVTIILGESDSASNYIEKYMIEYPDYRDYDEKVFATQLDYEIYFKRKVIDEYDCSDAVNVFYYNEQPMWLDRSTRSALSNTLRSAKLLGIDTIDIWYNDICITLDAESAEYLLAQVEMYATACYNVTARHKVLVSNMDSIEDVIAFDITSDYPEKIHINTTESSTGNEE